MDIFNKQSLTAEEQINLLILRGLRIIDKQSAINIIKRVGYYHLSSYMRNFQKDEQHNFQENVEFNDIYNLFNFDQELRHITFAAIEKVEIAYRTAISNVMCKKYGSHWFIRKESFRKKINKETNKEVDCVQECKEIINKEIRKKDNEYAETFIANYYNKYLAPELPPFWMVIETFTIGSLNKLFQLINLDDKTEIIKYLGMTEDAKFIRTTNWLYALSVVRNICAHHSRLFNRVFRIAPTKHIKIGELQKANNNTFYYIAMIINFYLILMSKDHSFEDNLQILFAKYPQINKSKMGFPVNWEKFNYTRLDKQSRVNSLR